MVGAREHFEGATTSDTGYLRPSKLRLVDVFVSRGTLDRALDTANALFLALERRGHQVTFAPRDQHLGRPAVDERGRSDSKSGSTDGRERYGYDSWGPDRPTVVHVGTVAMALVPADWAEVARINGRSVA